MTKPSNLVRKELFILRRLTSCTRGEEKRKTMCSAKREGKNGTLLPRSEVVEGLQGESREVPASTTARAATTRRRNFRGGTLLVLHLPRGECGPFATWKFAIVGQPLPSLWDGVWSWGRPWQRASSSTCGTSRLTTPAWPTAGWWCGWTAGISIGERCRLARFLGLERRTSQRPTVTG